MSSWVCVDASVVVRLVTGGEGADKIARLWAEWGGAGLSIGAPNLLIYEVTNALWRYAQVGELEPDEAVAALDSALGLGIVLHADAALHRRALELARRQGLAATYDAHYVALADMLDTELWTTDARLVKQLGDQAARLRLIERG
jgi:predicted nucleic acid-binding protein